MKISLIIVYHGGQILNTSTGMGYDIRVTHIFSADETINLRDMKIQIYTGLELLPSQFSINISARINTALAGSGDFLYSLFGVISNEIWRMIKTTTPYQLPKYKTLELVVESKLIFGFDDYYPTNIPESSNLIMAEEKIHSQAREQQSSRAPVQNVDVDEDNEEEKWHLNVEEDDIQDETDINMDEIEDAIDVEEIVKELQMLVSFINRRMKHQCTQFADNIPMSYADEPYFRKSLRIDE
jgi:hypothetical protein